MFKTLFISILLSICTFNVSAAKNLTVSGYEWPAKYDSYPENVEQLLNIYYMQKTACKVPAHIKFLTLAPVSFLADKSKHDPKLRPWVLPKDIEVEVDLVMCGIHIHAFHWLRDWNSYFTINATMYLPVEQTQAKIKK